jgi:fumarate reductase subunit C
VLDVRLYLAQRISAMLMAPLVLVHLGVMIYAIQGGLDAGEILARTQGSILWGAFYGLFVIAAATHAAIGLRVLVHEYLHVRGAALSLFTGAAALVFLVLGGRAVVAVVL